MKNKKVTFLENNFKKMILFQTLTPVIARNSQSTSYIPTGETLENIVYPMSVGE